MRVTVEYMTQVRRAVGRTTETLEWPGGTLADLVRLIAERHNPAASVLLDGAGFLNAGVLYFVDDERAAFSMPIPDGAVVTIMTPMAGGAFV